MNRLITTWKVVEEFVYHHLMSVAKIVFYLI
jgi:hypothetical protein